MSNLKLYIMSFIKTELFKKISRTELLGIRITIGDSCGNGYENIHLNCDWYEPLRGRTNEPVIEYEGRKYVCHSGGIDKDVVLLHFPQLAPVLKVNGCDMFGFDSYPIMNTKYNCSKDVEYSMEQYRLTKEEVKMIGDLNDLAIAKFMYSLSKTRYKDEISEAVKVIEKLSGETYKPKEHISHQLENDIVYCITSNVPKNERGWNLLKGQPLPTKYSIDFEDLLKKDAE